MASSEVQKQARPIERGDWNMAYLFPQEVAEARDRLGLVILPLAPVEWHGPHLTMGCDPLLAHGFARNQLRQHGQRHLIVPRLAERGQRTREAQCHDREHCRRQQPPATAFRLDFPCP